MDAPRLLAGLLTAGLLAALPAGAAQIRVGAAGCGGVETAHAQHPGSSRPPLAIGDSTMLLALPRLARDGFDVNAKGCRQYPEALALLRGLAASHQLPHMVVIALGANGSIASADIAQARHILGPERVLVLLTPRELGGGSGADAALVRAEGRRHGSNVAVLDWVDYSAGHSSWFEADGLHVNPTGAEAMSRLISTVLPLRGPPRAVRAPHCVAAGSEPPTVTATPPAASTHALTIRAAAGTLRLDTNSDRLHVPVHNSAPDQMTGLAEVQTAQGHVLVGAACFTVSAGVSVELEIPVDRAVAAGSRLLSHYAVSVALQSSSEQSPARAGGSYLLRPGRS